MAADSASDDRIALRPRARILRTLGEELISSETVAILELVKNAYDADASSVLVRFSDSLEEGRGRLEIFDDGHGMDLATVRGAWMEPATSQKRGAERSRFLGRRLLGEKGVGRFAAARLAEELELITRAFGDSSEIYAFFDWTQFDRDELYLDEVLILTEARVPQEFVSSRAAQTQANTSDGRLPRDGSHGTVLRMNRLKRSWGRGEIEDLRRGLSRLTSPFEQNRDFRILLQLPDEPADAAQEVEPPKLTSLPGLSADASQSTTDY